MSYSVDCFGYCCSVNYSVDYFGYSGYSAGVVHCFVKCSAGPGAWLVVEGQVAPAAASVGSPLQLLISPEIAGVPFVAWVGMADGADWNRADPAGVKPLDNQAAAVSTVAGH